MESVCAIVRSGKETCQGTDEDCDGVGGNVYT